MSDQTTIPAPQQMQTPGTPKRLVMQVWRAWRLRMQKARQRQRLDVILTDPHIARDLGLPVRQRPNIPRSYM